MSINDLTKFNIEDFNFLSKILSEGTISHVYICKSSILGIVAVKIYDQDSTTMREVECLSLCRHPNIVQIYGILFDRDVDVGLVLEYIPYSLSGVIHNFAFKYELSAGIFWIMQVCRALMYLEKKNIVHRDVKPSNLLIGQDLKILKICDFGVSGFVNSQIKMQKSQGAEDVNMTVGIGTVPYMAPETFEQVFYSSHSDVYSLAITIWEIVSRKRPYYHLDDKTSYIICKKVLGGERPLLENDIPDELKSIIMRAWEAEPLKRPSFEDIYLFFENLQTISTPINTKEQKIMSSFGQEIEEEIDYESKNIGSLTRYLQNDFHFDVISKSKDFYLINCQVGSKVRLLPVKLLSSKRNYSEIIYHPNIISCYGIYCNEMRTTMNYDGQRSTTLLADPNYLLVQHVDTYDFDDYINTNSPSSEIIKMILLNIGHALIYLHETLKIPYGDLSTKNIYLKNNSVILEHPLAVKDISTIREEVHKYISLISEVSKLSSNIEFAQKSEAFVSFLWRYMEEKERALSIKEIFYLLQAEINKFDDICQALENITFANKNANKTEKFSIINFVYRMEILGLFETGKPFYFQKSGVQPVYSEFFRRHCMLKIIDNIYNHENTPYEDESLSSFAKASKKIDKMKNAMREIQNYELLHIHHFIVTLLGFVGSERNLQSITGVLMEASEFGTLENYIEKEASIEDHEKKCFLWAWQIASALEYCHDRFQIMHRDITPESIFIFDNGYTAKLANFSYSKKVEKEYPTMHTITSLREQPYYKAPEVLVHDKYGFSSDIWSFGMVLYYMTHRARPFNEFNRIRRLRFIGYLNEGNRPSIQEDLNHDLAKLLQTCWFIETEENRRPTAAEIKKYLEETGKNYIA